LRGVVEIIISSVRWFPVRLGVLDPFMKLFNLLSSYVQADPSAFAMRLDLDRIAIGEGAMVVIPAPLAHNPDLIPRFIRARLDLMGWMEVEKKDQAISSVFSHVPPERLENSDATFRIRFPTHIQKSLIQKALLGQQKMSFWI
jgi:hypothetical protein